MNILAVSGSLRAASSNTALLREIAAQAAAPLRITICDTIAGLPLFSPDLEGALTPPEVLAFAAQVQAADAVLIACPEYARALPGGFKNAIDWLVSRDEIIGKAIFLAHATHRGDDVMKDLHRVLATVSDGFHIAPSLRVPLVSKSPQEVRAELRRPERRAQVQAFLGGIAEVLAR